MPVLIPAEEHDEQPSQTMLQEHLEPTQRAPHVSPNTVPLSQSHRNIYVAKNGNTIVPRLSPIAQVTRTQPKKSLGSLGSPSPRPTLPTPPPTRAFHFVLNSDKKRATQLRNTIASRMHRESKVSRIKELEKELERREREADVWQVRAKKMGWKE